MRKLIQLLESTVLPMDHASRMARARQMGFDTSTVWYHFTSYDFSEFVANPWRGATYFASDPDAAMRGAGAGGMEHPALSGPTTKAPATGPRLIPIYAAGKIWGRDPMPDWLLPDQITYGEFKTILNGGDKITVPGLNQLQNDAVNVERMQAARRYYDEAVPPEEYEQYAGAQEDALPLKLSNAPVAEPLSYESIEGSDQPNAFAPSGSMSPAARRDMIRKLGYVGWIVSDEAGKSLAVADPRHIRAITARFDPHEASSTDIMA